MAYEGRRSRGRAGRKVRESVSLRADIPGRLNQAGQRGQMLFWVEASFPEVVGAGMVWEAREPLELEGSLSHVHSLV